MSQGQHENNRVDDGGIGDSRVLKLLQAYLDAEYRWERNGLWFPLCIGAIANDLEQAFPQAREFALLSAWNPQSLECAELANRTADAALHAALRDSGAIFRAGFSSARNRTWREPSWVTIDLSLSQLDTLSRRFGQLGTLYARRGEPMQLRMYAARPQGAADQAHVRWLPGT